MQFPTSRFTRRALCAATLALALPAAMAWTDKPVKMVVPAPSRRDFLRTSRSPTTAFSRAKSLANSVPTIPEIPTASIVDSSPPASA